MIFKTILFLVGAFCVGSLQPGKTCAEENADKTLELRSEVYYTIQKGDTLWDLSEHFFDSPWVWPDLWQKNERIANPHWIYPGERIRLFRREELETMIEPGPETEPEVAVQPEEPPYYFYPSINRVGFIRETPIRTCGSIFKVKEDKEMVSENDLVYIRPMGAADFKPGDRFTVLRTLKPLPDREAKAYVGIQHYILGLVEVTDVQPEFAIGRIVQSFRHIELNDLLIPYEPRSPKITLTETRTGVKGKIIASEEHESMFADHAVVFIDRGRKDGVRVGQSYSIYYQEKESPGPTEKEGVLLSPVDFGKILVLRTEDTTATALVTMADNEIEPGAKIRARQSFVNPVSAIP
jgi:hypothetical protein